jgi:hypothetical protein
MVQLVRTRASIRIRAAVFSAFALLRTAVLAPSKAPLAATSVRARRLSVLTFLVAVSPASLLSLAAAQDLSAAPGLSGPVGPPPDEGARVHDGFYLRASSGFAVYDERFEADGLPPGGSFEGRNRGFATVSDLAIGGTVAPGWVIGGGIFSADLVASTLRTSGDGLAAPPAELDPGLRNVSVFAPFVDWYPNVRGGFHARAALGLSTLTPRVFGHPATERSEYLALGGGLVLGAGYDWWVADEWSIGVMSQVVARLMTGRDDDDVKWTHLATTTPGLYVSLTYH